MNIFKLFGAVLLFTFLIFKPGTGFTQITSTADEVVPTEYAGGNQDKIHIFCGEKGEVNASLIASLTNGETGSFEWQKYNSVTGNFDFFSSDLSGNSTSTISNLENGCYRVKVTATSGEKIYTAWVFNNYIDCTAEIPESDCNSFTLKGTFDSPKMIYTDLFTRQQLELNKGIQVRWLDGNVVVSRVLTSKIFDPPTKDTYYTFEVTDKFGCVSKVDIQYKSIVTKALFSVTPDKGEAPLEVTFNNESENGDPTKFEWFIFRDLDEIKRESAANNGVVKDSILVKLFNDSPVYVFENSGKYKVKLVSKKISEFHIKDVTNTNTCYDTVYLEDYIVADTSFVDAPNVFTPNGDGTNDEFIIKFWSMKEIKISIFNRWGKLLHVWESNNVINFKNTIDSVPQSVWDGKVGGKVCTPGVYYYVVEGRGRDNERRRTSGFFHLFRDK
jgi:gliding motility-associated-like protein